MSSAGSRLSRDVLLDYFLRAAVPRPAWRVGLEVEKMGRRLSDGRPIPYDGEAPTVRAVLDFIQERRGGQLVLEDGCPIGIDAPWGSISLEPGGQVEWSSPPYRELARLERALAEHLQVLREAGSSLGIAWLDEAVDPRHEVLDMPWMPKARYRIMRDRLGARGALAHRMMTQTASIHCAFDFADAADWARKFRAAAVLAPVATAMFANSRRVDGADSGFHSFRQAIWRETDDDRCGLPPIVFEADFGIERWIDWVLDVPLLFRRRGPDLVLPDGSTFRQLLEGPAGHALELEDWVTHCSSIFTQVRSYTYLEVRSADLQPDDRAFAVPAFWTGTLYGEAALDAALDAGSGIDHAAWSAAMDSAARLGLGGRLGSRGLREVAAEALEHSRRSLRRGDRSEGDGGAALHLEALASRLALPVG